MIRHVSRRLNCSAILPQFPQNLRYIPSRSLHTLNCVHAPEGKDEAAIRRRLLEDYSIEIGASLGPMVGKALRIGLMGHSASIRNVDLILAALGELLK